MHSVARAALCMPQLPRLVLDRRKIFPPRRRPQAEHIFNDEDARLKKLHVVQEIAEEVTTRIDLQPFAVVCSIHLSCSTETLARGAAYDHIHTVRADACGKVLGVQVSEIFLTR